MNRTREKCEEELKEISVQAIVSGRVKSEKSLKTKLYKRNAEKRYDSTQEAIMRDRLDFVGLRISLYFPDEHNKVTQMIKDSFQDIKIREFSRGWKTPEPEYYQKKFGNYAAKHYWIQLHENDRTDLRLFAEEKVEIQVFSVLFDAWAEISHDLQYRTLTGELSAAELRVLDGIKGLVETGQVMLEHLHQVHLARVKSDRKEIRVKEELELCAERCDTRDRSHRYGDWRRGAAVQSAGPP